MALLHVMFILGPQLTRAPVWDMDSLMVKEKEKHNGSRGVS